MKKILGILILSVILNGCSKNKTILKEPKVDKRVELLSIVFRLADCHEYKSNQYPNYVERINEHFGKYKNHELIEYIRKELRYEAGIGFGGVMEMAINITDPPLMKTLEPDSEKFMDSRWTKDRTTRFLLLLNKFYQDANCEKFFDDNSKIYAIAENRFTKVHKKLNLDWYQHFYGQTPKGEFVILIGLGNGGANYGVKNIQNGKEIIYSIMGTSSTDSLGLPKYDIDDNFPTLLHEFNHSFVNHIVEKHHSELEQSGKILFSQVKDKMEKQAYGDWQTMYNELLVRSSVVKYLKDHNAEPELIEKELNIQLSRGFIWTDKLVQELEHYDKNRDEYKTLESFMPEIVAFYNKMAYEINPNSTI